MEWACDHCTTGRPAWAKWSPCSRKTYSATGAISGTGQIQNPCAAYKVNLQSDDVHPGLPVAASGRLLPGHRPRPAPPTGGDSQRRSALVQGEQRPLVHRRPRLRGERPVSRYVQARLQHDDVKLPLPRRPKSTFRHKSRRNYFCPNFDN